MEQEQKQKTIRHRGTDSAKVIQVIETTSLRGSGTDSDPIRAVRQIWNFNGDLIAENDPFIDEESQEPFPQFSHMK